MSDYTTTNTTQYQMLLPIGSLLDPRSLTIDHKDGNLIVKTYWENGDIAQGIAIPIDYKTASTLEDIFSAIYYEELRKSEGF
jgi:hypothetical protein